MHFNIDQASVVSNAARITILVLDVDGVLTDGRLYFSDAGEAIKVFHTLDGHGIKMLKNAGMEVGIITGRRSGIIERRARDLGIELLYQGREDKLQALREMLAQQNIPLDRAAYAGDDLPDLPTIEQAGLGLSVPNGHPGVQAAAQAVTRNRGGAGAVREMTDFILQSQDRHGP